MIGRAAIGNPWIFREIKHYIETGEEMAPPTAEERLNVCLQHLQYTINWEGLEKAIHKMRGRYLNYLKGFPDINNFTQKLVRLNQLEEVKSLIDEMKNYYEGFELNRTPISIVNYHEHCRA
jgi:tRNA-dihydrouridine synthase